jgi:hypothetical protein
MEKIIVKGQEQEQEWDCRSHWVVIDEFPEKIMHDFICELTGVRQQEKQCTRAHDSEQEMKTRVKL